MPDRETYVEYGTDPQKASVYGRRLFLADAEFDEWKDQAEDWYHRYENLPRRQQFTGKGKRVNVPTGVATIDALFAAMTAVEVEGHITNLGRATRQQVELATAALVKEWKLCDVMEEAADATKDALVVGIGWVKVGYEYQAVKTRVPRARADVAADIEKVINRSRQEGMEPPSALEIANLVDVEEEVDKVLRDRIVVDYVPYDQMRWDPNAKRIKDITWYAQYTKMHVDEVKQNPVWREYVKRTKGGLRKLDELKGGSTYEATKLPDGKPTQDEMFVDVVELWDMRTGTICTFVKGQKWFLNEGVNPFALNYEMKDRSPFVPLVLRKTNMRVRGISDMEVIAPSLDEQGMYRARTAQYIERFVPKVMGPEDALTDEGKEALSSPEYGAYVSVAREYAQDAALLKPLEPPALPTEAFDMERRIEDGIREASGVNELMRGLFPDRKRTATETAEVVSASTARQSEKRNRLEHFFLDIQRRMVQLMQGYYTQERMVRYVDSSYADVQWTFTADDIAGEFDFDFHLTPKEATTKQSIRDDGLAFFNMIAPFMQPGPDGSRTIDPVVGIGWLGKKFGLTNEDLQELFNTPEQKTQDQAETLTGMAAAAQAQAGVSPLDAGQMAAAADTGAIAPGVGAAAVGGIGPLTPQMVEEVSESAGVRT